MKKLLFFVCHKLTNVWAERRVVALVLNRAKVTASGVCLVAGLLLPVMGQQVPSGGVSQVPAGAVPGVQVFDLKSYDLGKITWYASADLAPGSSLEEIRTRGTPTTPTVTLRSAVHGGTGILFCFVQLPDPLPPGCMGRLTIGDIDGNDEAFWNGEPIGSTTNWGVSEFHPRVYNVDFSKLRSGINILALRMSGPAGRPTFGVKSKTLSFCLAPGESAISDVRPDSLPSVSETISMSDAVAAIRAADDMVSQSLIQRKRTGFGRFGEFYHNGLPAVSEISPTRVATQHGPIFDVLPAQVNSLETVRLPTEPGIDGWHHLVRVKAELNQAPLVYTARQSLLYPGTVLHLEEGEVLQLRVRFPEKSGYVLSLDESETTGLFDRKPDHLSVHGFLPVGKSRNPAMMVATGLSVNVIQGSSHIDVSLARIKGAKDPAVYLFYPVGLYKVESDAEIKSLTEMARLMKPDEEPLDVLKQWLRIGLYEPTGVDEYFTMVNNESAVRVYQATRYSSPSGLDLGGPFVMRPPQIDYAREALNYPVAGPVTSSTGVLAYSGDVHYSDPINAETAAKDNLYLISYDLPVPLLRERAPVNTPGQKDVRELVDVYAMTDMGTSRSVTAVDAIYKSRTQAYQAFSFLSPENQQKLNRDSAQTVPLALGGHFWNRQTERFTGQEYWGTYYLEGPYYRPYDIDWGNGLSLYGLSTYIKYTGKWDMVAENWDAVERIFRWFTVSDDWEWMRASNSAHGHGTGAGDCQNAVYAAAVGYTRLAKGAQRTDDYYYGLYTMARTALPTLNRFVYNDFAAANGFIGDQSLVLGFLEGKGFVGGELTDYPWAATSNISGNGVQPENFDLYMTYAQDAVRNYEQIFEKSFPQWLNGMYEYQGETMYRGNSGYITLPHIYMRARLGGDSFATLTDYIEQARTNENFWWQSPPVLAEIVTKKSDDVMVMDWGRGQFVGAAIERTASDKRRKLTVRIQNRDAEPNVVSIRLPGRPHRFSINNGPVPLTDSQFENGELKLKVRRQGENVITVEYSER